MCLISVCPKGTEKDSKQVLDFIRSGASCNGQGSGFMYKRNGQNTITISKGYFHIEKLIEDLLKLKLDKEDEVVFHHRIGTSGGVTRANTHPFVISTDNKEVCEIDITTDKPCLVHNGVFFGLDEYENRNKDMSDTYAFVRHVMSNPNIMNIFLEDRVLFKVIFDRIIGTDKLCLLFPNRDLELYGKYIETDGYFHSNGGYFTYTRNIGGVEYDEIDEDTPLDCNTLMGFGGKRRNNNFSSRHESKSFDTFDGTKLLPSPKPSKLTKIVTLDNKYIIIDSENYKHFRYIRKGDWDYLQDKSQAELLELVNFDINILLQTTSTPLRNATRLSTITTHQLLDNCYYIPKGTFYEEIYSDYKILVDSNIEVTKSGYKTLDAILRKSFKKAGNDKIYYKKLGLMFCKKALMLHAKDMNLELTSGKKGVFARVLTMME